jgi:hypothetical protein
MPIAGPASIAGITIIGAITLGSAWQPRTKHPHIERYEQRERDPRT